MKSFSPSAERNRDAIADILRDLFADRTAVLEIASGSGQHAVYFAAELPHLIWHPTDADKAALASIAAWRADTKVQNLAAPQRLDTTALEWPDVQVDAMVSINMIHISPWQATLGLLDGAAKTLPEGGILYLYGPYKVGGKHTAPSNEEFEGWLKAQDPSWGVRNLDDVGLEARRRGLHLIKTVQMPANNFSVIFRKTEMVELED